MPRFWTAEERYTPIYEELGGDDAVTKYSAAAALLMTKLPAAQHLEGWQHDEIFQGAEFTTLRKAAKHPKAVFDTILEEFVQTAAEKSIMVAMKTNLKGVERGTAKAQAKFGGDVTQISDVVRATVVVTETLGAQRRVLEFSYFVSGDILTKEFLFLPERETP